MSRSFFAAMAAGCVVFSLLLQCRFMYLDRFQLRSTSKSLTEKTTDLSDNHCLSLDFEDDLDQMISSAEQMFILMPAKAAGTSMKKFTSRCIKNELPDNFINYDAKRHSFLTQSLVLPPFVTSHLYSDETFIHLARHATQSSLVIQMYRDETDRLSSAIAHVVTSRVCKGQIRLPNLQVEFNATHCIVEEESLLRVISSKCKEIDVGATKILTCAAYDAIASNEPNLAFVSYKNADKLQKLIARHHCAEIIDDPERANTAEEKTILSYVRLSKGEHVRLDVWLHHKKNLLEWALNLKKNASCQGKTKHLGETLNACPDKAIKVTGTMVAKW